VWPSVRECPLSRGPLSTCVTLEPVPGWGVIPSIRVEDMAEALAFYVGRLEFTLTSGGDDAPNSSLTRGDGRVMLETAADFYGDQYNQAIRERLGMRSPIALYIEAEDLVAFPFPAEGRRCGSDHRPARFAAVGARRVHRGGPCG